MSKEKQKGAQRLSPRRCRKAKASQHFIHPPTNQTTDRPTSRTERGAQRKKGVISLCSPPLPLSPSSLPSPCSPSQSQSFPSSHRTRSRNRKRPFLDYLFPAPVGPSRKKSLVPKGKPKTPSQKEKTPPPPLGVKEPPFPARLLRAR